MSYVIGIGISAFIGLIVFGVVYEQQQWAAFAEAHACKIVGQISSSSTTAVGIGTNGGVAVTPVIIPGKTGYACNDGVTYWR